MTEMNADERMGRLEVGPGALNQRGFARMKFLIPIFRADLVLIPSRGSEAFPWVPPRMERFMRWLGGVLFPTSRVSRLACLWGFGGTVLAGWKVELPPGRRG